MDKIIHHIRRHKKCLMVHMNKHHKKYLFVAGTTVGIFMLKIIGIVGVFFGVTLMTGKSDANNQAADAYKAISIFNQIDDMAHREIYTHSKEGHISEEEKEEFKTIDIAFHNAQNLNEKYRTIKKIANFLTEHEDEETHAHTAEEIEREKKLEQLLEIFNQIQ